MFTQIHLRRDSMKKILSFIMAAVVLLSLFALPALCADTETSTEISETKFDPASSDTQQGKTTQKYILAGIIAVSIILITVIVVKNFKDSKDKEKK